VGSSKNPEIQSGSSAATRRTVNLISKAELLLLLVTVLSQTLFTLVSRHLMSFTLFSARHVDYVLVCY